MKLYYQRFPEDKDKDDKLGKKTPAISDVTKEGRKSKWQTSGRQDKIPKR